MATRRRIIHLIQSLGNGGCENMLLRTLPLVSDFEHLVLTLKEPGELAPKFMSVGIPVESINTRHLLSPAGIRRLRARVQEKNTDIIITYLFHADLLGRLALNGATHAPIVPFLRTTFNHPRYAIARIFEWLSKSLVRRYLANSEAVKDFYVQHIGVAAENITVIPNGIDTGYFDQLTPDPELRATLSIGPDNFVITCVANLHPNKGHEFLLKAFEALWPDFPHLRLLLVGDGEERRNIETMIAPFRSKDAIRLLGRRSDVPAILKLSHLFVLPTLFEGQSNAILEAMAAGVPIITTDIPENRACIEHETTGLLVPAENVSRLSEAIKQLITDPVAAQAIMMQAKTTIKDRHGLLSIVQDWNDFLHSV